jgi:hypothetical protein
MWIIISVVNSDWLSEEHRAHDIGGTLRCLHCTQGRYPRSINTCAQVTRKIPRKGVMVLPLKAESYHPETHVIDLAELRQIIFEIQKEIEKEPG